MSCDPERKLCTHRKSMWSKHCMVEVCENYYGRCSEHSRMIGSRR